MSSHEIVSIDVAARKLVAVGERLALAAEYERRRGRPRQIGERVVPEPAAGSDRPNAPWSGPLGELRTRRSYRRGTSENHVSAGVTRPRINDVDYIVRPR